MINSIYTILIGIFCGIFLSFLFARMHRISSRPWIVILGTILLSILVYTRYHIGYLVPSVYTAEKILFFVFRDSVFFLVLLLLGLHDFLYMKLPDTYTYAGIVFALICNIFLGYSLNSLLFAAFMVGSFFALQFIISRGAWIGGGDIKFGCMMGVMLGFPVALVGLFFSYVFGALVGTYLYVGKKLTMTSPVPFGVFLSVFTFFSVIFGESIASWYLSLL